mgnify:CR=1 FL=1
MAISVKPVLISEKQMEAIKKIQEEQRKKSEVGVAPTIHEIARGLMDKALAYTLTAVSYTHLTLPTIYSV